MFRLCAILYLLASVSLSAMDNGWDQVRKLGIDEYGSLPQRPSKPPLVEIIPSKVKKNCHYCLTELDADTLNTHILAVHNIIAGEQLFDSHEYPTSLNVQYNDDEPTDPQSFHSSQKRRKLNKSTENRVRFAPINNPADDDDDEYPH